MDILNIYIMKSWQQKIICKICGKEVSKCALTSHLKWSHNKMTYKEYFDTFIEPFEHKCPYCNNERKWIGSGGRTYALTCCSNECLSKIHSDNNGGGTQESIKKIKQTKQERYGDPGYHNIDKMRKTCQERYGVDNPAQTKISKQHFHETLLKKGKHRCGELGNYAVYYNNEKFDSKSELLFYYWCIENGYDIIKNPKPIEYSINDSKHLYYPDFIVNGIYVEIKGKHLIDNEGYLLNFINGHRLIEKTQCLKDNNVKIILHTEVEEKYKPTNYEELLSNCISFKNLNIDFPKCPYCGDYVKIKHHNPLSFTKTCCKKECIKKIHNERKDKQTGIFKKK